jgi:biotin carboxyl carrier protein
LKVLRKGTEHVEDVRVLSSKDGELQVQIGDRLIAFSLTPLADGQYELKSDGVSQTVRVLRDRKGVVWVHDGRGAFAFELPEEGGASGAKGKDTVTAPTPGKIVDIAVSVGDAVNIGDTLVVLEAMKMEQRLSAEVSGRVLEVLVALQEQVDSDAVLVRIEPDEADES